MHDGDSGVSGLTVENGGYSIRETINGIEKMNLSEATKKKIYEGNARRLLHL